MYILYSSIIFSIQLTILLKKLKICIIATIIMNQLTQMDLISLIENLPIDLLYLVTNYDPLVIFHVDKFIKYDWFKLIRMNFSLRYQRDLCTNEEIMRVYLDHCSREKTTVIAGYYYTIIKLEDGTLMCCGRNQYGELGLGDQGDREIFNEIKGIDKNIVEMLDTQYGTIIRLTDGTLMACGYNNNGHLAMGAGIYIRQFSKIPNIPNNVVEIIVNSYYTILKLSDGTLMSCGYNQFGQLGLGDTGNRGWFTKIRGIPKNIVEVISNCHRTIIRLDDGTLMGCGYNEYGQLGMEPCIQRNVFREIGGIPKNITKVICGALHTIIVLTDGTLMTCGSNGYGQLGLGDRVNRYSFEKIKGIDKNIVEVTCGEYHTMIRFGNGTLMVCGSSSWGILGTEDNVLRDTFYEIKGIPKNIAKVISSHYNTVIILTDGTLMGCGRNGSGQLGLGDTVSRNSFVEIKGIPKNIAEVSFGFDHGIIKFKDGTFMGCGSNAHGQLGFGDRRDRWTFEKLNITVR
ncbi:MAG: chromosome condensation regulator RCC1 [Hyperionvirus sp.]|uniref:Chromosome condensation regulator RCC1 n=1 Tax=Hyperionvirus sp. TaxID=2487770 RepID=A0A3G5A7N7_9VIRU|nr:MAG: chromosome condensation regulator RCC1 [Hyperionvirus sp.]